MMRTDDRRLSSVSHSSPGLSLAKLGLVGVVLAAVVFSARGTGFSLKVLLSRATGRAVQEFLTGLFPPNLDPAYLRSTLGYVLETVEISVMSTALAVLLGFPLSLLATRRRGEEMRRGAQGTLFGECTGCCITWQEAC